MISLKSELNSYASTLQLRCPACNSTDADFLEHISKAAQVENIIHRIRWRVRSTYGSNAPMAVRIRLDVP
jgi:hypothetical protein